MVLCIRNVVAVCANQFINEMQQISNNELYNCTSALFRLCVTCIVLLLHMAILDIFAV